MSSRPPKSPLRVALIACSAGTLLFIALGFALVERWIARAAPVIPPVSSASTVVRPTGNVLLAVRDLARLESASYHMERVIDLSEKQSHLFGLVQAEDAILLVAVADISAGVDLSKLKASDIQADPNTGRVRVTLPPAEILSTALDDKRTYVHTRRTSALARRQEALETRARQEAERALEEAAREAGILERASHSAVRVVEGLVRSLGYTDIEVRARASGG